jgi:hypothetical protein
MYSEIHSVQHLMACRINHALNWLLIDFVPVIADGVGTDWSSPTFGPYPYLRFHYRFEKSTSRHPKIHPVRLVHLVHRGISLSISSNPSRYTSTYERAPSSDSSFVPHPIPFPFPFPLPLTPIPFPIVPSTNVAPVLLLVSGNNGHEGGKFGSEYS